MSCVKFSFWKAYLFKVLNSGKVHDMVVNVVTWHNNNSNLMAPDINDMKSI